jgi:hypothetical protein
MRNIFENMLRRKEMEDAHQAENNPVAENIQREKIAIKEKENAMKKTWEEKQAAGTWSEKVEPGATEVAHENMDERIGGSDSKLEHNEKNNETNL